MAIKPIIETGWLDNGSVDENSISAMSVFVPNCTFLGPPRCSALGANCGGSGGGGGGVGLGCGQSPCITCNNLNSDPVDQS